MSDLPKAGTFPAFANLVGSSRNADMARYFFDLSNGEGLTEDEVGVELLSRGSVRGEVSRILTDIAGEEMLAQDSGAVSIEVRDERGQPVFEGRLTFESRWSMPGDAGNSLARP